jgi:hypothetical protein
MNRFSSTGMRTTSSTEPELIVGNFTPDSAPSAPPAPDLQLVRDFGDGEWLLRKVRR